MENAHFQKTLYCKTEKQLFYTLKYLRCTNYMKLKYVRKFALETTNFVDCQYTILVIPKHFEDIYFLLPFVDIRFKHQLLPKKLRVFHYKIKSVGLQFVISKYLEHIMLSELYSSMRTHIKNVPKYTKSLKLDNVCCPIHVSKQLLSLKCGFIALKLVLPKKLVYLEIFTPKQIVFPKHLKSLHMYHIFYGMHDENIQMYMPENLKIFKIESINANKIIDNANCNLESLICAGLCPTIINLPSNLLRHTTEKNKSGSDTRVYSKNIIYKCQ